MKQILQILAIFGMCMLPSCVQRQLDSLPKIQEQRAQLPEHVEQLKIGRYGDFSYILYSSSMQIMALNPDIPVYLIDVFDTDIDGAYDLVFAIQHGTGIIASTKDSPQNIQILSYVALAHVIRDKTKQDPYSNPKN